MEVMIVLGIFGLGTLYITELFFSVFIPILIGYTFSASFPEFYDSGGFLTGLGMMLVAILMCLLNSTIFATLLNFSIKKYLSSNASSSSYFKITLIILMSSIALQILLTFLIENPLGSPSTAGW